MRTLIFNTNNLVSGQYCSRYRYQFIGGGYEIKPGDQICLQSLTIPYSWFNILQFYNNMTFQIIYNSVTYNITLPAGFYQLSDINAYIQNFLVTNNLYLINATGAYVYYIELVYNIGEYAVQLNAYPTPGSLPSGWSNPGGMTLTGHSPQMVIQAITTSTFGSIIGFSAGTYPASPSTTEYSVVSNLIPNFTPVNSVVLNCSVVNNVVSVSPNAFTSFSPVSTTFGANIVFSPTFPAWLDTIPGKYNSIDIYLTDQSGNQVPAKDSNVCIEILIKSKDE
jgi:hypothetical protein